MTAARGQIPKPFLDDLRQRVDLVDLVGRHVDLHKAGAEYKGLCPFHTEKSPSFTVKPSEGFYHCFGCGAHGDAVEFLTAHLGLGFRDAVEQLAAEVGMTVPTQPTAPVAPAPTPRTAVDAPATRRQSVWRAVVPVPETAPEPTFAHWHHGTPSAHWAYRSADGAHRMGYVVRFDKPDGRKELLPLTWCVDESDDRGTCKWNWKQWDAPRPLFFASGARQTDKPVLLVEGEKCAEAAARMLPEFDCVTWPGGGKAWAKADWACLAGATVIAWADADVKRKPLRPAEVEAGAEASAQPVLPLDKQPGYQAMAAILTELQGRHACAVSLCPLHDPATQTEPDGWDVADAIAQGWSAEQLRAHIATAQPYVPPDGALSGAVGKATPRAPTPAEAGAGGMPDRAWRVHLLTNAKGEVKPVRENIVLALEGLPAQSIPGAPDLQGVIAYNAFTNDVVKLRDAPWGSAAGAWSEVDDLKLGEYLVRQHFLPSCSRQTLEEAVRIVAHNHVYHPVRDYLTSLQWDGTPRLNTWLMRACLTEDEWDLHDPLYAYLARVGTWFLQAMCARIMQPGIKFDYLLILEGEQGMRKSSLFATLGGTFFADTGLTLGDKDSYQNLQGKWIYEFAELDSLGKAEVTKVKSFVASAVDRFRASFDRRSSDYPRQCVFGGTTNEHHYLTDPTGNRRMWPVRISRMVDIEWVRSVRDQLFAEAMQRWREGKRMHPTPQEERDLFAPQQQARQVENAIEVAAGRWLYDNAEGQLVNEISLVELLGKLGIGVEKLGPGRFHEKQAGAALRKLGWTEARSSTPGRPRVYRRPQESTAQPDDATGVCPL